MSNNFGCGQFVTCNQKTFLKSLEMIPHLFLHASLFLVCSKNDVAMKIVENFLHFTTMVSNMYHRPTLSRIATCSLHFACMRTKFSPCSSLAISSFMFEPPLMHLNQNKYFIFFLFDEPSPLLLLTTIN